MAHDQGVEWRVNIIAEARFDPWPGPFRFVVVQEALGQVSLPVPFHQCYIRSLISILFSAGQAGGAWISSKNVGT
jgi:hypothetical protein